MNEPKVAILLCTALLAPAPRGLAAQIASNVEAGQYTVSDGALPVSALRLAPNLQYRFSHGSLAAHTSALVSEQRLQLADGIVSGTFTSPTVYGIRAEMLGNASRAMDERSLGTDQIDLQTRVHVLFHQSGGMWFGAGVARPWRVAVVSSADVSDAGLWAKVGDVTRALGVATFTSTFTNFSFSKVAADQNASTTSRSCAPLHMSAAVGPIDGTSVSGCDRQSHFGDLEGSIQWEMGALELHAQAGHRFGDDYDVTPDSRQWASGMATLWLNDRVAIIGGGGRQPALPLRGLPARSYGMAGIELAYWPLSRSAVPVSLPHAVVVKSFDLKPAQGEMQKIVIRVGGVERVDVMGDFSDWSPLTLTRRGRDQWELSLPLSAGVHQVNVRVDDGPWVAPPDLPTVRDGYSGEVGLIVVHSDKA